MTELQLFDIPGAMRQGYTFGTQQRLQREGEQKRNQLAALASQAYGADPQTQQGLVQQAYAIDPEGGATLDKQAQGWEDKRTQTMLNMARMLTSVPQAQRAGIYRQMVPTLKTFGLSQLPDDYTPETAGVIDQTAQSLVDAWQQGSAGTVQSTYIDAQGNRVAILRDGTTRVLGANAPNNQIIDTGNGFYGVNKGNLQAAPVMIGGQQQAPQAPSGYVNTPSGPVNIDPSLPPEIRAQIAANPDQFTQGGMTQGAPVVQDGAAPQPQQPGGGQQLFSAPKPAAERDAFAPLTSEEVAAMGYPAGTVAQRNLSTGQVTTSYTPPASSSNGRVSQTQMRQANAAKQKLIDLQSVRNQLDLVRQKFAPLRDSFSAGIGGNFIPSVEGKQFDASVDLLRQFIRKLTRTPGEGSMSDWEGKIASLANPSRGDYEQVTADKLDQLDQLVNQLEQGYGAILQDNAPGAEQQHAQAPGQQPAAPGGWSIQKVN